MCTLSVLVLLFLSFISILIANSTESQHRKSLDDLLGEVLLPEKFSKQNKNVALKCVKGILISPDECNCTELWTGSICDHPVCLNGGRISIEMQCDCYGTKYTGVHCENPLCIGGRLSKNNKRCRCLGKNFGSRCQYFCWYGQLMNGRCKCKQGYYGRNCDQCDAEIVVNCPSSRQRPDSRSRFALTGLSLCLITIVLLWMSVVTRRRRAMMAAQHLERLSAQQQDSYAAVNSRQQLRRSTGDIETTAVSGGEDNTEVQRLTGFPSPFYPYAPLPPPPDWQGSNLATDAPPSYEEAVRTGQIVK